MTAETTAPGYCVDCGSSLAPPRPLYCHGIGLHRDASGRSYETPADRAAADAAMEKYRRLIAQHPGDEVTLWCRLMGIDPRERMRFFSGLPPANAPKPHAPLLRAIGR